MLWWDESLATGVQVIDQQHKGIFDKVEEILSLEETTDIKRIKKSLKFLVHYAMTHFADEESLMIQNSYPDFLKHREEHTYFMKELFEITKGILQSSKIDVDNIDNLKLLVVEWLANHIHGSDKTFVAYSNSVKRQSTNSKE